MFAQRRSSDPLIQALGLLLVGVRRSSAISTLVFLVVLVLLGGLKLSHATSRCASASVDLPAWTTSLAVFRRMILSVRL